MRRSSAVLLFLFAPLAIACSQTVNPSSASPGGSDAGADASTRDDAGGGPDASALPDAGCDGAAPLFACADPCPHCAPSDVGPSCYAGNWVCPADDPTYVGRVCPEALDSGALACDAGADGPG